MSEINNIKGNSWAIVEFDNCRYRLKEMNLLLKDAESLAGGKYRDRDIILTVSSEDLSGRIAGLNSDISA